MKKHSLKDRLISAALAAAVSTLFLTSCGSVSASVTVPKASSSVTYKQDFSFNKAQYSSDGKIEYYFPRAGQKAEPQLIKVINSAQKNLDVAIYSLTDNPTASAIVAAHKKGVSVRVISDKQQSGEKYQESILRSLTKSGIPVKVNTHTGLMHLKVTIADQKTATTGSFNYTKSAETKNDEVFVVLHDEKVAKDFDTEFNRMWNDKSNFKNFR